MSSEAPSDEILSQETLTRRNNVEPRYLSIRRDGRITLPTGTVLDALRGTILFNGTFLDSVPDGNIIQGRTTGEATVGPNTSNSTVLASEETTAGTGDISELVILCSKDTAVSGNISRAIVTSSQDTIVEPTTFNFTGTSDLNFDSVSVTASNLSRLRGNLIRCSITSSYNCRLQSIGTLPTQYLYSCGISNSSGCAIRTTGNQGNELGIYSCTNCTMDDGAFNRNKAMIACRDSTMNTSFSGHILMAATDNSTITGSCFRVLVAGEGAIVNNLENVFCFSGTATDDDQAMLGVDLQVSGLGNNITANDGYVQTERGLVQNYREITATGDLLPTDGTVLLNSVSPIFLNFPSAASIGANYPLGTVREFTFIGLQANEPSYLQLVGGGNTFNNKSSWTRHRLNRGGERVKVQLINSLSPYWSFDRTIIYTSRISSTVADNFGVAPPQVDASILPTSTGQLNHQALGSGSYYTLGTMLNDNPQTFSLLTPGFRISTPGRYTITYYITVDFSGDVAGHYVLRTDLLDVNTSSTISNSYLQTTGLNSRGGSRVIISSPIRTTISVSPFDVQLRISQDSVNTISSNASITSVIVEVVGNI